jgi:hypothetical protein
VELNPVRAGLVKEAGAFRYSSAAAHLGKKDEFDLVDLKFWDESGAASTWGRACKWKKGKKNGAKFGAQPMRAGRLEARSL